MSDGWDPSLATGIELIDAQHREYFARVNRLLSGAMNNAPGAQLETFDFMSAYVVKHFGTEQDLMDRHAYPYSASHKAQHAWFCGELEKARKSLTEQEPSALSLSALLVDWFRNHIQRVDRKLVDHLRSRGVA